MRKFIGVFSSAALLASLLAVAAAPSVGATSHCTPTGFYRDSRNMTAALISPTGTVSGEVNATGCNIGVYYGPGSSGTIDGADIHGANYFGVLVNGGSVDVTGSSIHEIGETPFNGAQHGVAIYYATVEPGADGPDPDTNPDAMVCGGGGATPGRIDGNTIFDYQKGGIVANCAGTAVMIIGNTVTGLGPVGIIAQNGIQVGFQASGTIISNTVTGNIYTQGASKGWISSGILLYQANLTQTVGEIASSNHSYGNQANIFNVQ